MSELNNAATNQAAKEIARWRENDKRHVRVRELPEDSSFLPPFELSHQAPLPSVLLQQYDSEALVFWFFLFFFLFSCLVLAPSSLTRPIAGVQYKCFVGLFPEVCARPENFPVSSFFKKKGTKNTSRSVSHSRSLGHT